MFIFKRRILSIAVIVLMLTLSLVSIASANSVKSENTQNENDTVKVQVITDKKEINEIINSRTSNIESEVQILDDSSGSIIKPAGANPPTQTWDLRYQGGYQYNTGNFWGYIYTNYRFVPYYDGTICFSIDGLLVVNGGYRIDMICSDGSTRNLGNYNDTAWIYISGLDISKTYYFKITEYNSQDPYYGHMYGTIA